MEEEDFEGYVKQFRPGLRYPYEVAYDDGDEEWGWFSATQFHTDEVSRKYNWLTDQDEAVARAAAKALMPSEEPTAPPTDSAKPETANASAVTTSSAVAASVAPASTGTVGSIALKKDQLRAARDVLSHRASGQAAPGQAASANILHQTGSAKGGSISTPAVVSKPVLSDSQRGSTSQPAQSAAPSLPETLANKADGGSKAPAVQYTDKSTEILQGKAALMEANAQSRVSDAAAAKLQLTAGAQPPTRKRRSDQLQDDNSAPSEAFLASAATLPTDIVRSHCEDLLAETKANQSDLPKVEGEQHADTAQQQQGKKSPEKSAKQKAAAEKRVKHANDPQLYADVKEQKRRRLRKVSERDASDPAMKAADDMQDGARLAGKVANGKVGKSAEPDNTLDTHQERRESNAKATTSGTAAAAEVRPAQQGSAAQDRKRKQPSDKADDVQPQRIEDGAAGGARPASGNNHHPMTRQSAAGPAQKLTKAGSASIADDKTDAAHTAGVSSQPGVQQHSSKVASLPPFALAGSASNPSALSRPISRATSISGGISSSTRISLPPKLTQLTSLRSKPPVQELKGEDSPVDSDTEAEEAAAAAAAAAAVEAHLKGVTQQFDSMLHNTLQRTKESVHKVTQFAVRAAVGKHGKTAAHRLVIMILDLIETAQMSKRVDLFYLLDSLLQVSLRESKEGSEAKVEASKMFSRVIAAGLHRVAAAMAKDSECITKASKVLELWQRRQILAKSVLKPALDLLGKMKGEHEAAAAAAAMAANKMGQPLVPRRSLRLVMPYALLDSDTGLPTHTICYPLDQWGSLAGFRFPGEDGQVTEFELRPNWRLPLQEAPEDWDINPATEDLPLDQVLAAAADMRREHLAELEEQKEARALREASPWADRLEPHDDYTTASPTSLYHGDDAEIKLDGEEGPSPAEGETGYYETAQDSAFQFEPPRAPAHYGASRNSPSEDLHRAGSSHPWGAYAGAGVPWGTGTLGSTWGHMPHTALHSQQSLYDPMSQSLGRAHPRLQELAEDQLYTSGRSQSPESGRWFNVPFDDNAQPTQAAAAAAGTGSGVQYQHRRASAEQAVQPQVAVRDSNVDFDMDTGFSDDDDAPPPLPAEPPPGPDAPPLPSEEPLPPLPPEEDRPPLPPDDPSAPPLPESQPAGETRLAAAGLFEPFSQPAASQPGSTPPPLPPAGFVYGFS